MIRKLGYSLAHLILPVLDMLFQQSIEPGARRIIARSNIDFRLYRFFPTRTENREVDN